MNDPKAVSIVVYKVGGIFKAQVGNILLAKGGNYDLVVANAKVELGKTSGATVKSVNLMAA